METKKIKNYDIIPPKKSAFTIDTEPDMIKLHCLLVSVGKRGGGKSTSIANLIEKMMKQKVIDKVLIITPTYNSNREIYKNLNINDDDVFDNPTKETISNIIKLVEDERKEWNTFETCLKAYESFQKFSKTKKSIHHFDSKSLLTLYNHNSLHARPEWKYGKDREHMPRIALIIDDCLGTPLFNPSSKLLNLCIKHRHIADGMGLSIFIMCQSYSAQGGLNRAIRENCTDLMLFKNKDKNQIKKICEEIGTDINVDKFLELFEDATKDDYGFLFIHFNPKQKHLMFRKCLNEYYVLDKDVKQSD